MKNLLNFLTKYSNLILFLVLEGIAFYLLIKGNNYHNSTIIKEIRGITSGIERKISNTRSYFHLREINQTLANENVILKQKVEKLGKNEDLSFFQVLDTIRRQQYLYTSAEVMNNSVNRQKNFFTLNKGTRQGIQTDMAVISESGVAGVVIGASQNYSVAMSLLNLDFRLSARIKSNGYFGSLAWDGVHSNTAILSEIPQHVAFTIGDTVETTGFSVIFPEGVFIGTISSYEKPGGDFFNINITLGTDFRKLHYVKVIQNTMKDEQIQLESVYQ